jgi:flagellar basal body-associated protein FliL
MLVSAIFSIIIIIIIIIILLAARGSLRHFGKSVDAKQQEGTSWALTAHSRFSEWLLNFLNSVDFSPQANYTDRTTAACRRS